MRRDSRGHFLFLNVAHAYDHLFMLLFPTVVLALQKQTGRPYEELLPLATGGFVAFAAGTLPAGWLGDRWSRQGMLAVFFFGIGGAAVLTGCMSSSFGIAAGLTLIGLFAAIYHPVGIALVVSNTAQVGRDLGVNGVYGNLGVAFAALIAGALSDLWSWRAAFIVPGIICLISGVGYLLLLRRHRISAGEEANKPAEVPVQAPPRAQLIRLVLVLAVAGFFGGLIFHATTVALPKSLADGLLSLISSTMGIGIVAALVYAAAAFAQVVVGKLLDRTQVRPVLLLVAGLQVPLLWLLPGLTGVAMLLAAFALMLLVFGQIPINDTLVARNTPAGWRSRVYALKYVFSIGVSVLVVPLVARAYGFTGDFSALYGLLAGCAVLVALVALVLPGAPREAARAPAPAAAPGVGGTAD